MKVDKKYIGNFQTFRLADIAIFDDGEKKLRITSKITSSSMAIKKQADARPAILEHFHKLQIFFSKTVSKKPDFEFDLNEYLKNQPLVSTRALSDAVEIASLDLKLKGKIVESFEKIKPPIVQLVFMDNKGLIAEIIEVHPHH